MADWRAFLGAMMNPELRSHLAHLMLGDDVTPTLDALSPSRRTKQRAGILGSGVVIEADDGTLRFDQVALAQLLASEAKPRETGLARFVQDNRLVHWPSRETDRADVLAWLAPQALAPNEVVDERTITERLEPLTGDPVTFRRYLYDAGLIERTRDGQQYALVTT